MKMSDLRWMIGNGLLENMDDGKQDCAWNLKGRLFVPEIMVDCVMLRILRDWLQ